jgi:putative peptidoglycan lipid II flippase
MLGQTLAPAFVGVTLPLLVVARRAGDAEFERVRALLTRFGLVAASLVTLVLVLGAPWLTDWMAPGFSPEESARAASQLRWLSLLFLALGLSFPLRSRLNNRGVFWPGASTSLTLSLGVVFACGLGWRVDGTTTGLVIASVIAAWCVLALHQAALRRADAQPQSASESITEIDAEAVPLRLRALSLAVLGASLYQLTQAIPRFLDRGYASEEPGALAALEYSFNVLTAPGILFGTSLVMLAYPSFARFAARGEARAGFRALGKWFVLAVGAAGVVTLACQIAPQALVHLLYERGEFGPDDVTMTSEILRWQAWGLPAMVASMGLAQALLGLRQLRLLLLVGVIRIVIRVLALQVLVPQFGPSGLGAAYFATEAVSTLLLVIILWRVTRPSKPPASHPPAQ